MFTAPYHAAPCARYFRPNLCWFKALFAFIKSVALFAFVHDFGQFSPDARTSFDIGTHASASLVISIRTPKRTSLFIHFVCDAFLLVRLCSFANFFIFVDPVGGWDFFFLVDISVSSYINIQRCSTRKKKLCFIYGVVVVDFVFVWQLFVYAGFNRNFDMS